MRLVSIEMIKPTMTLAFDLYFKGALVMNKGSNNVDKFKGALKNMGMRFLYVEDEISKDIEIRQIISEEIRKECGREVDKIIGEYRRMGSFSLEVLDKIVQRVVIEIAKNKDGQISINSVVAFDEYTSLHSTNVMMYSMMIAQSMGYSNSALKEIGVGALLHDIGEYMLPIDVHSKEGKLSEEEFRLSKKHCEYGEEVLNSARDCTKGIRDIALMHHEKQDGTGYPNGLKGEKINEYAQIVSIADVYDALTSDRSYRKKWSAQKALDYLYSQCEVAFKTDIINHFIKIIAIYPNGSLVRLSDGRIGLVKEQSTRMPQCPIIKICYDEKLNEIAEPYLVDLTQELTAVIEESELEIDTMIIG